MSRRDDEKFTAVTLEGGFLPPQLLRRIADGDPELPGTATDTYGLGLNENVKQAAARHWSHLRGAWLSFQDRLKAETARRQGPVPTEVTVELTRAHWLQVLFSALDYGQIPTAPRGGARPAVSHLWRHVPIHLVDWNRGLDERIGKTGPGSKGERAPQAILQEHLNGRPEHLWGILSNGRDLRLLRDSSALVGASYLEFDLESIFEGELFDEFALLFATLHASRLAAQPRDDGTPGGPADCWLEKWRTFAHQTGVEAKDKLREQVRKALEELGTGFLEANRDLCEKLRAGRRNGGISEADFEHELLRLAYQLLFLFVAEDRDALLVPLPPDPDKPTGVGIAPGPSPARGRSRRDLEQARERYHQYFSTARLRRIADARRGDRHSDLWHGLVLVLNALGNEGGRPELALPELGGLYLRADDPDAPRSTADDTITSRPDELRDHQLPNSRLLAAVRLLSQVPDDKGRLRRVDFGHLGSDELGSVYESLLELVPRVDLPGRTFALVEIAGNDRKTTGSYYTPTVLIDSLLESALDPVIENYANGGVPDNLLKITVCDPACGSGHFLVAAARRIALRYAQMYADDAEPSPAVFRYALDKVVRNCIYGVDISPLAVELTKVSLWLESIRPGRPLAFLDGHIRAGNALLGVTPRFWSSGIPDAAFKPGADDSAPFTRGLARQNEAQRSKQDALDIFGTALGSNGEFATLAAEVSRIGNRWELSLADVREQTKRQRALEGLEYRVHQMRSCDAWCAAFAWPKHPNVPEAITTEPMWELATGGASLTPEQDRMLARLTSSYKFFHWHLEFPEVFENNEGATFDASTDGKGGFSCVLGNPPWEQVELKEEEFFAAPRPDIALARTSSIRKGMIDALRVSAEAADRDLYEDYRAARRESASSSRFLKGSGRYPLTTKGRRINTFAVFAELAKSILALDGYAGQVLPTGIATAATPSPYFRGLVAAGCLVAMLEFENEEFILSKSKSVDHRVRFCLLTIAAAGMSNRAPLFACGSRKMADVWERSFTLQPEEIFKFNPNTGTAVLCRSVRDVDILTGIYSRVPVLWRELPDQNPWQVSLSQGLFNTSSDSGIFNSAESLRGVGYRLIGNAFVRGPVDGPDRMLPLYEAKMVHSFDHRYGTYDGQTLAQAKQKILPRLSLVQYQDPRFVVQPRHWVAEDRIQGKLEGKSWASSLLGWRDVTRSTDERTVISTFTPRVAVGHKFLLAFVPHHGVLLQANLSAFVLDYCARQKYAGASFSYHYLKQLPILAPSSYESQVGWLRGGSLSTWIATRSLELVYTSWDMEGFARDLSDNGPPFVWDVDRRFILRAEIDAAYFLLYGVCRDDVEFIMDSFTAFKNNDLERFDATKRKILTVYDDMVRAERAGVTFQSELTPPPGEGPRHAASTRPKYVLASRPPADDLFSTLEPDAR